jgi:cyclic-di-GMP phosphodiesterase TipF (flagellum assembly factor)
VRISGIVIAVCMVLIAASLGVVVYLRFGFTGAESTLVAIAVLTGLAVYNLIATRSRERSDAGDRIAVLTRGADDLARQLSDLTRRFDALEANVGSVLDRALTTTEPLAGEIQELSAHIKHLASSVALHEVTLASERSTARRGAAGASTPRAAAAAAAAPTSAPARVSALVPTPAAAPIVPAPPFVAPARIGTPSPVVPPRPVVPPAAAAVKVAVPSYEALDEPVETLAELESLASRASRAPIDSHNPIEALIGSPDLVTMPPPGESFSEPLLSAAIPAMPLMRAFSGLGREGIIDWVRSAIEANRIDLYLQPIVSLPARQVRFYEATSRLKTETGDVVPAAEFLSFAVAGGLMPRLDNLALRRSVQVVRRLLLKNRDIGLFCNLSGSTLRDAGFAQLLEFIDANRAIAPSLVFEFTQSAVRAMGPVEHGNLAALAERGFRFSMDNLATLRLEPRELSARGFRFVKVPGRLLLERGAAATDNGQNLAEQLSAYSIDLIAERIESEDIVVDLLDRDVGFGQGYLFSPPRPVRADALQGGVADAALGAAASAPASAADKYLAGLVASPASLRDGAAAAAAAAAAGNGKHAPRNGAGRDRADPAWMPVRK